MSQPDTQRVPTTFDISYRNGAYYISVPNYHGGTVYTKETVDVLVKALEFIRDYPGTMGVAKKLANIAGGALSVPRETQP